jgi:hypothetical protein
MIKTITDAIIPHTIGLLLMIFGWYISILNVGLTRFQTDVLFTKWTGFGLLMIIIGAYLPWVWTGIRGKLNKD